MSHIVKPHETHKNHYYVNGFLIAGATDEADAIRIYEEAHNSTGP